MPQLAKPSADGHRLSDSAGDRLSPYVVMVEETGGDEPFQVLHRLIRAWCDSAVPGSAQPYPPRISAIQRLPEAWRRLYDALNNLRATARYEQTDEEAQKVDNLIDLARRIE